MKLLFHYFNLDDDSKLQAMQEFSENLETMLASPQYSTFLESVMPKFLNYLRTSKSSQQLRKLILEIIHRIPPNEAMKNHVKPVLQLAFSLIKEENEEIALVCIRIIIELHKQFRPPIGSEVQQFLNFIKKIYTDLPANFNDIFEMKATTSIEASNSSTAVAASSIGGGSGGVAASSSSAPVKLQSALTSLKVLAELPLIVVLMYQLYKQNVHTLVEDFIPLIMDAILMQPSQSARSAPSFNRDLYADFITAQIKMLSFLAYVIRVFLEEINKYSPRMVQGVICLLKNCPPEAANLRRDLLIAIRHILSTDLRNKFVPQIDKLFNENVLIGPGWTARTSFRPLAYSTLADLVHHVRTHLPLNQLSLAVHLFSKNIHDDLLPISIQVMSCKLVLNLVECLRQKSSTDDLEGQGREILIRMLEVFIRKLTYIAKNHVPVLLAKKYGILGLKLFVSTHILILNKLSIYSKESSSTSGSNATTSSEGGPSLASHPPTMNVNDCRTMVRTLLLGIKTITWGAGSCKIPGGTFYKIIKYFLPEEINVFTRLLKYGLRALDIHKIGHSSNTAIQSRSTNNTNSRQRDEKELLEHYSGVFIMLNPCSFKEVIEVNIDYLVERIHNNYNLQIIPNQFLANSATSSCFASILINYLLDKLEEMGSNTERSNLYLKLFKLVFGSVAIFANENEPMLKPHLHKIVNRSMELALTAKEPYNYFVLMRALFRSIGGGSHDLLYQEFLPLLPNLLKGLNLLQSGIHKQHMKDLFVELCLTVPVRLSSLLPYLPMLMDPLVSALNGSQNLVTQGLRTLELCVDNLQQDFLYEHIQPVRAELMQALWRILRNPNESLSHSALRVLGKFGGGNRKSLRESQKLDYEDCHTPGPCISIQFPESKHPISLPVSKAIAFALSILKKSSTDAHYRKQAWLISKYFIVSTLQLSESRCNIKEILTQIRFSEQKPQVSKMHSRLAADEITRKTFEQALTAVFVAAAVNDLRSDAVPFMTDLVTHLAMIAIVQQFSVKPVTYQTRYMDIHVLIDAIAVCMTSAEKSLTIFGEVAITLIIKTAVMILGSPQRISNVPFFDVMAKRLCKCCYERAWFAKSGGCSAIRCLMTHMPLKWVMEHQGAFVSALLFLMMDLSYEVSSGTIDVAKKTLEDLLRLCNKPINNEVNLHDLSAIQKKHFHLVCQRFIREVISPNQTVREQSYQCLELLADITAKSVYDVMVLHKDVIADMIPPKKNLLRHQPVNQQIAIMDGNTFCSTIQPRLYSLDLSSHEHKLFVTELLSLCEADDATLHKLPCYKPVKSLVPLRKSALAALASLHYIEQKSELQKIFNVIFKNLTSSESELQKAAKKAMQSFLVGYQVELDLLHTNIKQLLSGLGDYKSLTPSFIQRLSITTELFPASFSPKLCDQLLTHIKRGADNIAASQSRKKLKQAVEEAIICAKIVNVFHIVPATSFKLFEQIVETVLKCEKATNTDAGSPFREPLLDLALRYPTESVDFFLSRLILPQYSRLFIFLLGKERAKPIRQVLETDPNKIIINALDSVKVPEGETLTSENKALLQYQGVLITRILSKLNPSWYAKQKILFVHLTRLWSSDFFQERVKMESSPANRWDEARLLLKCLLMYYKENKNEITALFQMLRAFTLQHICNFQFFREFLECLCKSYTIEQKRSVFFKFIEMFVKKLLPQEIIAKILSYLIIPMVTESFEEGKIDEIIGGSPNPDQDNDENIVGVFINKIIDPDNPFKASDEVRILLLQFSSLLVEFASPHIHDPANRQGNKLRRLMVYAWPCLLPKQCMDPSTKYFGHLLLAHIIARFAIHRRIVLQVFHSLLKAHALEAKAVVRHALDILTPAMPARMEDGNTLLAHWTKKIIVEDGHITAQLVHILYLVVRHQKVYYSVRHLLVQHMINAMQKLGFPHNSTIDHRKLATDLAEVIIKWELRRVKEEVTDSDATVTLKRSASDELQPEAKKQRTLSQVFRFLSLPVPIENKAPIEKSHSDSIVNFLIRLACSVHEPSTTSGSPNEALSQRCISLLKIALKPELWQNAEIKIVWFDRIFSAADNQPTCNTGNICAGFEIMTHLLSVLSRPAILNACKTISHGLTVCMACQNTKVLITHAVQEFLSKLTALFEMFNEFFKGMQRSEEINAIHMSVARIVFERLQQYERQTYARLIFAQSLLSTIVNTKSLIHRLRGIIIKTIHKLANEHLGSRTESNTTVDLLIACLDLIKGRISTMPPEAKRVLIQTIIVLIDRSTDLKLQKAIVKIVEKWVKDKSNESQIEMKEKCTLLVKIMLSYEKRLHEDQEFQEIFLSFILDLYQDSSLEGSELLLKLEPAFLSGLQCPRPNIREKFFKLYNASTSKNLMDRCLYICCSQNWEKILNHFWIKQCISLILSVARLDAPIESFEQSLVFPSVSSAFTGRPSIFRTALSIDDAGKNPTASLASKDSLDNIEKTTAPEESMDVDANSHESTTNEADGGKIVEDLSDKQSKFLESLRRYQISALLDSLIQLCHYDSELSHDVWITILPQIWQLLNRPQQQQLSIEMGPFLCSGSHVIQRNLSRSAINTFLESLCHCKPPIKLRPCVLRYLGKAHNAWHRAVLTIEEDVAQSKYNQNSQSAPTSESTLFESSHHEALDSLSAMYASLKEEDLFTGLWTKRCKNPKTKIALSYEQHGLYEQAQTTFEIAMAKSREDYALTSISNEMFSVYQLWEEHWIKCSKELGQWDLLLDFGKMKQHPNPLLVLESAWRVPDWAAMKEALNQVEVNCPETFAYKLNLYRGYIAVCQSEDPHVSLVEKFVDFAATQAIRQWRHLPKLVSYAHIPILQAAQLIVELQEAGQIHSSLQSSNVGRNSSVHDMKAVIKTWRNRLPLRSDDLSHWNDVFLWRHHLYQAIIKAYDNSTHVEGHASHAMLGVHATATSIISYAEVARKQDLCGVCLDTLSRIHTIPSVPIFDCFQKIRQQIKCYLQMAGVMGKQELQEGLEVIESTNLRYFSKEMQAEFFALKGIFLAKVGRSDDANVSFSSAVQLHDNLIKAWALWAAYLEEVFMQKKSMQAGASAVTCYLQACRQQNASKHREHLAKTLWLLSFDDGKRTLAEAFERYCCSIPPNQWLPWVPQILSYLGRLEGGSVVHLATAIGRIYPQAVYFCLRTLFLTIKLNQTELQKTEVKDNQTENPDQTRITTAMARCNKVMHVLRDLHPTLLAALEGIVDQMVWFREGWNEEVLKQLRLILKACMEAAFNSRSHVGKSHASSEIINSIKKLVDNFGLAHETVSSLSSVFSTAASETLARRAQVTAQDPNFQKIRGQFSADFDFSIAGSKKLHPIISKLKRWIKVLEAKSKMLPSYFLIEDRCRFLSNYSLATADVELPGESLLPRNSSGYFIRIARFMPRVEIVHKDNCIARRLYIRGHNGKVYPYLVVNDINPVESRREERLLQLLRLLNRYFEKRKEVSKRHLMYTVPRVVAISPQMRLIEDNTSIISLYDIYKRYCGNIKQDPSLPVIHYYESIASIQNKCQAVKSTDLKQIMQEIQNECIPVRVFKSWAIKTYPSATDYWMFRKQFTNQLALLGLAEFALHLTPLMPEMLQIYQDSGDVSAMYYTFNIDDDTGRLLNHTRPVPMRLTVNIDHFLKPYCSSGPLTANMIAASRCLVQPQFSLEATFRIILRDEILTWHRKKRLSSKDSDKIKELENKELIRLVEKNVEAIMNRLRNMAYFENAESKVSAVIRAATDQNNLSRMDPMWYPWL
ncbi:uncharacterized protein TRIADDRAFT_23101 [Trichoplax adhaerens]|uniref:Transformation/transcription domain-associated protein n=1 Tax=Trichoplax adhaerens TaxID=10228 RepID=B3RQK5_TRIAD|nr:hypothetical protein TRIADDRAFT_23101 [Trichoplax adhaerens]EDV27262.1 hypothetical protein TRIADDRAFT_23101 [Trichoplax adhaerens]|eukprot:XP_002111258.1 hypothetical protein TRIADDRAFT_23101 [Trichoplax adhaerens]